MHASAIIATSAHTDTTTDQTTIASAAKTAMSFALIAPARAHRGKNGNLWLRLPASEAAATRSGGEAVDGGVDVRWTEGWTERQQSAAEGARRRDSQPKLRQKRQCRSVCTHATGDIPAKTATPSPSPRLFSLIRPLVPPLPLPVCSP